MTPNNVAALAEEVDVADIIAGALQTSRAHAYELMLAACAAQREKDVARFQKLGRLVGLGFWGACEIEVLDSFGRCEEHWIDDLEDLREKLDKAHDYPAAAPVATPKEGASYLPCGPGTEDQDV